ncbi:hypothetical protein [Fusobacterium varium]|uniref:hypothetical protein n=1 Tax=Fusobacterium varium TaxID=856 RepID=UPI001F413F58|nr:hypothetical protein [Fusobacterium varium]MCF2673824.1 hypothetical protein [Fusobacterium varium]
MSIWRINCKPGSKMVGHKESFEKWIEKEIIGIGWSKEEKFLENLNETYITIETIRKHIYTKLKDWNCKTRSYSSYTNILFDRMKKGDYVWIRYNGIYKLGIVEDECCSYNINPSENFIPDRYQIGFYRKVRFIAKDLNESEVPGKIVASFRNSSTLQRVYEIKEELSLYCNSIIENKTINFSIQDWKSLLSAEDIEEVVGLYLQIEKNLYVYTSSCKKDTSLIEFQLVDKNSKLYGLQAKSGTTSINADEYFKLSKSMKIFLFSSNDIVTNIEKYENMEKIDSKEITLFIEKYLNILPKRIKFWFI